MATGISDLEVKDQVESGPLLVPDLLSYHRGETLFVVNMTDCPKSHWQCRNNLGQVGYVPSADLAIDSTLMKQRLSHVVKSGR